MTSTDNPLHLPDFFALGERMRAHAGQGLVNDSHRAMEAIRRVEQLEWILVRCRSLEAIAVALEEAREERSPEGQQERAAKLELQILVEAFYHSAWRLMVLLGHRDKPLIGIGDLRDKCPGIRDVRNHLLEHPEKGSFVFMQSFSYGGPEGPRLKSIRQGETLEAEDDMPGSSLEFADEEKHDFVDRGLYVNAAELASALGRMLRVPSGGFGTIPPRRRA